MLLPQSKLDEGTKTYFRGRGADPNEVLITDKVEVRSGDGLPNQTRFQSMQKLKNDCKNHGGSFSIGIKEPFDVIAKCIIKNRINSVTAQDYIGRNERYYPVNLNVNNGIKNESFGFVSLDVKRKDAEYEFESDPLVVVGNPALHCYGATKDTGLYIHKGRGKNADTFRVEIESRPLGIQPSFVDVLPRNEDFIFMPSSAKGRLPTRMASVQTSFDDPKTCVITAKGRTPNDPSVSFYPEWLFHGTRSKTWNKNKAVVECVRVDCYPDLKSPPKTKPEVKK